MGLVAGISEQLLLLLLLLLLLGLIVPDADWEVRRSCRVVAGATASLLRSSGRTFFTSPLRCRVGRRGGLVLLGPAASAVAGAATRRAEDRVALPAIMVGRTDNAPRADNARGAPEVVSGTLAGVLPGAEALLVARVTLAGRGAT